MITLNTAVLIALIVTSIFSAYREYVLDTTVDKLKKEVETLNKNIADRDEAYAHTYEKVLEIYAGIEANNNVFLNVVTDTINGNTLETANALVSILNTIDDIANSLEIYEEEDDDDENEDEDDNKSDDIIKI